MWLYFNSNGQLLTILEHGSPARVGTTAFQIFAVFENITDDMQLVNTHGLNELAEGNNKCLSNAGADNPFSESDIT